jgi:hypothetical protein
MGTFLGPDKTTTIVLITSVPGCILLGFPTGHDALWIYKLRDTRLHQPGKNYTFK